MKRITPFALVITVLMLAGCASKVATTSTGTQTGKYSEDLSVLRPKIETGSDTAKNSLTVKTTDKRDPNKYVEARHAVNGQLDAVLDSIDRINLSFGVVDGFTIQFYSGLKREEALNVKKQLATILPDLDSEVQYVQPNFRVRAGKYINRLEAQKDYLTVKKHFPSAVVIPDRIAISELK